jgi:hypothetical protein
MRVEIKFSLDLLVLDDRYRYAELYYSDKTANALWDIRETCRRAEKNDDSLDDLIERIREILSDIPEEILG